MEKTSNFLLRYDIEPEKNNLKNAEWHLYLINDDKNIYISELEKPSKSLKGRVFDPYMLFPELPKTTEKDTINLKQYYKYQFMRPIYEPMLKKILEDEKRWDESRFKQLIAKRPDSRPFKKEMEIIDGFNVKIKEARYRAIVEECKPPYNNLYLLGEYYRPALPFGEFVCWTVCYELLEWEKQVLNDIEDLYNASEKKGLRIDVADSDVPSHKKIFLFFPPDMSKGCFENKWDKKLIEDIFPRLPNLFKTKKNTSKTYKMTLEKL